MGISIAERATNVLHGTTLTDCMVATGGRKGWRCAKANWAICILGLWRWRIEEFRDLLARQFEAGFHRFKQKRVPRIGRKYFDLDIGGGVLAAAAGDVFSGRRACGSSDGVVQNSVDHSFHVKVGGRISSDLVGPFFALQQVPSVRPAHGGVATPPLHSGPHRRQRSDARSSATWRRLFAHHAFPRHRPANRCKLHPRHCDPAIPSLS